MRRLHLREHANILKRLLIHVAGTDLGLLMRLTAVGTPRSLQERAMAVLTYLRSLTIALEGGVGTYDNCRPHDGTHPSARPSSRGNSMIAFTKGC
jgi:hypothetical protein